MRGVLVIINRRPFVAGTEIVRKAIVMREAVIYQQCQHLTNLYAFNSKE